MSSPFAEVGSPGWIGMGIGLGIFSSFFATAGLFVCSQGWMPLLRSDKCSVGYLPFTCFLTLFSGPFIAVPALIGLVFLKVWLVTLIGYSLPVLYICCIINRGKSCNNPLKPKVKQRINVPIGPIGQIGNNNNFAFNVTTKVKQKNPNPNPNPSSNMNTNNNINNNNNNNFNSNNINNNIGGKQYKEVWNFLKDIGLLEYYDTLISNGYESRNDINTLTQNDLNSIGITKHLHRKKILSALANNNNNTNNNTFDINNNDNIGRNDGEGIPPKYGAPSAPNDDDDHLPGYGYTNN